MQTLRHSCIALFCKELQNAAQGGAQRCCAIRCWGELLSPSSSCCEMGGHPGCGQGCEHKRAGLGSLGSKREAGI